MPPKEKAAPLVVDKTGTLTLGKPRLVTVEPAEGFDERELLRLAAGLERGSEHPLAAAIVAGAEERGVEPGRAEEFQSATGKGVRGKVEGQQVALGNRALMDELGVALGAPGDLPARAEELRRDGQTVMFVAVDGRPAGLLGVADSIKEGTEEALRALREQGLRVVMATGDSKTTAEAVARRLGIDEVIAEVLPAEKRVPASPWSRATCAASCAPAASPRRRCATSARTSSSPSSTTPSACRSPPASSTRSPASCSRR